ncbi:MAG: 23S rRNA pseudouridine(2605) synthase RluB [Arsenophonus sp.]
MNIKKQKSEKLQKALARSGYGSRREMEVFIQLGKISVNGQLATLGDRIEVKHNTKIRLNGNLLKIKETEKEVCRILAYYKREGELCTRNDPKGRSTVFDFLPKLITSRWIAIGRLDINTSGLLLFTTDGELANRLMHPSHEIEREYLVRIFGEINDTKINFLTKGIQLEDGRSNFKTFTFRGGEGVNRWFNIILTEGRNREVRRLFRTVDIEISRLIRVRYGNIFLPKRLPRGGWIELSLVQKNYLYKLVSLENTIFDEFLNKKNRYYIK